MWAAAGVAIASWLSSEQGRRASEAERRRMQNLLNSIQDPNFDTSDIDFPTFQVLERYVPQVSNFVQEQDPRFIEMSAEAKEGRGAQLEALRRLQQAGSEEGDIAQDAAINQAARQAAIANQGMQGQIRESFKRRGMGGSGMELGAALVGQQGAAENAALASEAAAVDAYKNRLEALIQSGELGGRIKGEELSLAEKNASILNDFNQRSADNRNRYNRYADETANEAQRYNIGEGQRVYEKNRAGRYDADVRNQNNRNKYSQDRFDNDMAKITGQQRQSAMNQDAIRNNTRDRNEAIQGAGNAYSAYDEREYEREQRDKDRQSGLVTASNNRRRSDVWG